MPNAYNYSNTAVQTTLSGNISAAATSINVAITTGFPPTTPYVLALDYGAATEELVVVSGVAGTTLTVTRGFSGTSAQSHSIGAVVRHVVNAQDLTDFRTHEAATGAVHGLTGSIVGTSDIQTLSNKTLTSPTINAGALSGIFTGTPTFSGTVTHTGEIAMQNLIRGTRATATDSQYETRVTGDSNARWYTQADGKHWWGSGSASLDTNLYRGGSGTLQTDNQFRAARTNLTDVTWISQRSADTGARWYMTAGGTATWGDGAGVMDTNLYRSAASTLKTDGAFTATGWVSAGNFDLTQDWATPSLAAGYTANGNSNGTPQYMVVKLLGTSWVIWRGGLNVTYSGGNPVNGGNFLSAALPGAAMPGTKRSMSAACSTNGTNSVKIDFNTDGTVSIVVGGIGTPAWVSLNGLMYSL